jgi:PadR family transcriptional regulator PadR
MTGYLGELEQVVLLAVARLDGEGYGVTLRREIEARSGRSVSLGSVYTTLYRLEEKGYVVSTRGEPRSSRGGRARRLFRIEPEGTEALLATRRMLDRMWEGAELEPSPRTP